MKSRLFSLFITTLVIISSAYANSNDEKTSAPKWSFDKAHSAVTFSIRHIFTPVVGQFNEFSGDIYFDAKNLETSSIDVAINVKSIDTKNEKRDNHLQSPDFFDADTFGKMTFKSTEIIANGDNDFVAKGILSIKDVKQTIELPFKLLGTMDHPFMANTRVAAFESSIKLNRNDYNVGTGSWSETTVVGNEVDIKITLEMVSAK